MSLQQQFIERRQWLETRILGQSQLVERLLIALLADGHLLVEGAPGLAKTKAIRELSDVLSGTFQRIQFTPDLLPSDITGSDIYRPEEARFEFRSGPIFHNLVLADEINRAPAKVQAALLEAMAERQVSVGNQTYPLPAVFLVMATQNPIEQEGTYPLPEAQLDRFLMHVNVDYPNADTEKSILRLARNEAKTGNPVAAPVRLSETDLLAAREAALNIHMADSVEEYLVQLVLATRHPGRYDNSLERLIEYGASPRATIALDRCARARAWLLGRDFVSPEDVLALAPDVLRHRIIPSFEAEAEGHTVDSLIRRLLELVPVA
ncbi:MAG: MoxR family ATPase [Pseudomonadales bacterium]|jgi:MoxR-like ATPase|nr:MoxR family ATPase [Cellvibrionales bacterium]MBP8030310.1 MoxR family ATPase [Pseudomonadales bacterium]